MSLKLTFQIISSLLGDLVETIIYLLNKSTIQQDSKTLTHVVA